MRGHDTPFALRTRVSSRLAVDIDALPDAQLRFAIPLTDKSASSARQPPWRCRAGSSERPLDPG